MLPWFLPTELGITAPVQALPTGSLPSAPGGWELRSEGPECWRCWEYWDPFVASLVSEAPLGSLCGFFGFFVVSVAPLRLLWGFFVASLQLLCGFCVVSLWSSLISKETAEGGCSALRFRLSQQTPLLVSLLQPRCTVGAFSLPTESCWARLVLP